MKFKTADIEIPVKFKQRLHWIGDLDSATAVIIHGGYWKGKYDIDASGVVPLYEYFKARSWNVCLIEYRRSEHFGGGWPGTNDDILTALQTLSKTADVTITHFLRPIVYC